MLVLITDYGPMADFRTELHSGRILLMDGALGTELQRAGLAAGECGELWNLTQPERVRAIHQAYRAAGAECLVTNTFQANPPALKRRGLEACLEALQQAALALARSACRPGQFVLGDIGPIVDPATGEEGWEAAALGRTVHGLRAADALLLETCSSPRVFEALRQLPPDPAGLPLLLSLAYQRCAGGELRSFSGHPPEWFAERAGRYGVVALGVNCGRDIGLDEILSILRCYRRATDLPLFARPNAGTPMRTGDRWVYPLTPESLATRLPELLDAGVRMVGGCCGTTPAHIAAMRRALVRSP